MKYKHQELRDKLVIGVVYFYLKIRRKTSKIVSALFLVNTSPVLVILFLFSLPTLIISQLKFFINQLKLVWGYSKHTFKKLCQIIQNNWIQRAVRSFYERKKGDRKKLLENDSVKDNYDILFHEIKACQLYV